MTRRYNYSFLKESQLHFQGEWGFKIKFLTNETYFLRRVGGGAGRVKAGQTCSPCGRGTELYH